MKFFLGIVVSKKLEKTAVVNVERSWRHPLYNKIVKRNKKFIVHDELGVSVGDKVRIQETRPMSKRKRWKIVEKIK